MEPLGESSLEKAGRRFQVLRWPPYYLRRFASGENEVADLQNAALSRMVILTRKVCRGSIALTENVF